MELLCWRSGFLHNPVRGFEGFDLWNTGVGVLGLAPCAPHPDSAFHRLGGMCNGEWRKFPKPGSNRPVGVDLQNSAWQRRCSTGKAESGKRKAESGKRKAESGGIDPQMAADRHR